MKESYYISSSLPAYDRIRTLKHDDTFAVFDCCGDIGHQEKGFQGIYYEGTRFLSRQELKIENQSPVLLSSTVKYQNQILIVDFTNPNVIDNGAIAIPIETLHVFRSKFLWNGVCYERLRITNFGLQPFSFTISLDFEADFADIFEIRGTERDETGEKLPIKVNPDSITFLYKGLDSKLRSTKVHFSPGPNKIQDSEVFFRINLQPKESKEIYIKIICDSYYEEKKINRYKFLETINYKEAREKAKEELRDFKSATCVIDTSNEQFNNWLERSFADLHMMITKTEHGLYPYAGVPWFSTIFGRDGIIAALQTLWVNPDIGKGVLANLAATQAEEVNPDKDAEPGKILHEKREGEMSELEEVPFKRYYGSVDATPLFIKLAGDYLECTGDIQFIKSIWSNIEKALHWIDNYGDFDRDGFVEYKIPSSKGLRNQGWKDSYDSIFHENGEIAEDSIALCEVQGYVYDAKIKASYIARVLGFGEKADELFRQAEKLRALFQEVFWLDDLAIYALAIDGNKRPCRVTSSNAGHCLYTGIADAEKAEQIAKVLMSDEMFSHWGIRTLATTVIRYNPMSYHNGSIWPHDNSIIASGMAKYGFKNYTLDILNSLFNTSLSMELHRLPELYCGFNSKGESGPTLYPTACSPQSWAVGSVLLLLQACLGISINASQSQLSLQNPVLPEYLDYIQIKNLRVGKEKIDLQIERYANDVGINILKRDKGVSIVIYK